MSTNTETPTQYRPLSDRVKLVARIAADMWHKSGEGEVEKSVAIAHDILKESERLLAARDDA